MPVSGKITTINLFLFSSLLESSSAAQSAAPDDIPANIPSFFVSSSAVFIASSSVTGITSSTTELS